MAIENVNYFGIEVGKVWEPVAGTFVLGALCC